MGFDKYSVLCAPLQYHAEVSLPYILLCAIFPSLPAHPCLTTTPLFIVAVVLPFPDFTFREQNCSYLLPPNWVHYRSLPFSTLSFSGQLFSARDWGVPQWGCVHERLQPPQRHRTPRYLREMRDWGDSGAWLIHSLSKEKSLGQISLYFVWPHSNW